ncbi:MAG: tRNA dimethylallyltransferase [Patescibacteria group bacterium]|jgi:tRNA dimethylallyltransferase|nr:tRNA dimethylallyltransferase [Patescibacteria group bacterium]
MKRPHYNIIAIIGPTASGKSDLAIALAKKYDGEIISADSRQVYRGMDIGTGKVVNDFPVISNSQFLISKKERGLYLSEGIIHHLIDVASPKREYNISHFLRDAKKAITDIEKRGKLPIICGGTHFWIQALITGQTLPEVKPDKLLRAKLEKKSVEELFAMLEEKDPERAETIDAKNKYRLIRALEICDALGSVPNTKYEIQNTKYNSIIITLNPEKEILRERIRLRLEKRFEEGMIEEVQNLRDSGISWKRLEGFGLEYRYIARFLQGKISEEEMKEKLFFEIWHYAKRQLSFIRRWEKQGIQIHWIEKLEDAKKILEQKKA